MSSGKLCVRTRLNDDGDGDDDEHTFPQVSVCVFVCISVCVCVCVILKWKSCRLSGLCEVGRLWRSVRLLYECVLVCVCLCLYLACFSSLQSLLANKLTN